MYTFIFLILIYFEIGEPKILSDKLNVLLILADDGGFEMGTYRNKICQTPNLDQLAKNSLIFNKAFTSVSSCSPSRAALLTGMPSHQNGIYGLHQGVHHFDSFNNIRSISKILKENKIRTGIIGKKHVGPDSVYPFDFSETEENNSIFQVGRNITHIKLLTRQFLNTSESFFLYVAFHDPHRCGHTNPEYGEFCQRFGNGEPGMGLIPDWQPIIYQPDELELPYFIPNTWEARKDVAAQYTTMSRLDQGVGLIINELKKSGHYNNTLIIYSSDNAIPFPSGRTNFYDSGIAEPLFISSPIHKERKGQVTNSLSSLLDIVPTLLDWYGIENDNARETNDNEVGADILTGKSLLPLLEKEPADKSKEIVFGSHNLHEITMYYPMRMARSQRYKLIHNLNYYAPFPIDQDLYVSPTFQDILNNTKTNQNPFWYKTLREYYKRPEWELYDLKYDPEELNNVVKKNSSQAIFNELKNKIYQWQKHTKDPWICSPHAVFENVGRFKNNPECLDLDNAW